MEIILKKDVEGVGFKDDIVTVKNGFGRNFLIPNGSAILATPSAKKVYLPLNSIPGINLSDGSPSFPTPISPVITPFTTPLSS